MSRTALAVLLATFIVAPGGQSVDPDDGDYAGMVVGVVTDAETQSPVGRRALLIGRRGTFPRPRRRLL